MKMVSGRCLISLFVSGFLFLAVFIQGFGVLIANVRGEEPSIWGKEIVHTSDLILDGNQTFLIENCTFTVKGVVTVRDNAILIVRDAELNVSTDTAAGMVIPSDNGTLIVEDGELNLNYDIDPHIHGLARICDIDITDKATLNVENSRIFSKLGRIWFRVKRYGRAILNSTGICEGGIEAFDDSDISMYETQISSIKLRGNSSCVVQNSDIRYFSGSDRYTASFSNSTIGDIEFVFGSSSKAIIESRLQGFHRYWNIYSNLTVEGIEYNLTLHDTTLTGLLRLKSSVEFKGIELKVLNQNMWYAECGQDSELYISNCTCKYLSCGRHDSIYCINNSKIGRLMLRNNAFASISKTKIDELDVSDFKGALVCDNVTLDERLEVDFGVPGSQFYMCGGLRFGMNFSINEGQIYEGPSYRANFTGPIQKFKVIRGYRVVTRRDRKPLENVQLKLYNEENKLIREGTSDSNGEAAFNITYHKNWIVPPGYYHTNHTDTLRLEASYGPNSFITALGLLSDTPIIFNFPKPKPLWTLWQFWIGISILSMTMMLTTFYIYTKRRASRAQTNV